MAQPPSPLLWLLGLVLALALVLAPSPAAGQASNASTAGQAADAPGAPGAPRFRTPVTQTLPGLSARLLSNEERSFLAELPVVRVAIPRPPFRPYEDIGADNVVSGIHPDMLVTLGKAFGIRFQPVVFASWADALAAVRNRDVDVVMTAGPSQERLRYLEFTLGATPSPQVLFGRRGRPAPETHPRGWHPLHGAAWRRGPGLRGGRHRRRARRAGAAAPVHALPHVRSRAARRSSA